MKKFSKKEPKKREPIQPLSPTYPMRINKYLAMQGHSTRRGADELIEKKLVFINGRPAKLGDKIIETDKIDVKFRGQQKTLVYFAYNKPKGIVTHSAQGEDEEIKDVVPIEGVFPVGRLDKDSHGLIILTNDGRVTDRLLGPKYAHEKEYVVKTKNPLRSSFKKNMEAGVKIDDDETKPCKVEIVNDRLFRVILTEGKKHQIRRMCVALFQEVEDLERVRIMNIRVSNLAPGKYRPIIGRELEEFLGSLGLK